MLTPISDCVLYLSSDQMARGRFLQLPALHCGRSQNSSLVVGVGVEMLILIAAAKIPCGIEAWKWTCFDFASTNIPLRIPIASLAIARARARQRRSKLGRWRAGSDTGVFHLPNLVAPNSSLVRMRDTLVYTLWMEISVDHLFS